MVVVGGGAGVVLLVVFLVVLIVVLVTCVVVVVVVVVLVTMALVVSIAFVVIMVLVVSMALGLTIAVVVSIALLVTIALVVVGLVVVVVLLVVVVLVVVVEVDVEEFSCPIFRMVIVLLPLSSLTWWLVFWKFITLEVTLELDICWLFALASSGLWRMKVVVFPFSDMIKCVLFLYVELIWTFEPELGDSLLLLLFVFMV